MRRATAVIALALWLAGCQSVTPATPQGFELVHSKDPADGRHGACSLGWWTGGQLVADGTAGTSLLVEAGDFGKPGDRLPIQWWPKFTGRLAGSQVDILDPDGNVVATTGRRYRMEAAFPMDAGFVVCGNCGDHPCITELLGALAPGAPRSLGFVADTRQSKVSRGGG